MSKPVLLIPFAKPHLELSYLLTGDAEKLPFVRSITGMNLNAFARICIIPLKSECDRWGYEERISAGFHSTGLDDPDFLLLDHATGSQPETIAFALKMMSLKGPFWCKDPDNYFKTEVVAGNFVTVFPLDYLSMVNPQNKCYLNISDGDYLLNITEKRIIGRYFCSGGYGFEDADHFLDVFERIKHFGQLFLSHIIYRMLLDGDLFRPLYISNYQDWGTKEDWMIKYPVSI